MRILISSVASFLNSGYGSQSRYLISAFQELGHTVLCMPHHGLQSNGIVTIDDVDHLPTFRDGWGTDIVAQHVREAKIDAVINFHDCWTLPLAYPRSLGVPWITYSPIDSTPVPPKLVQILREANHVVAMSRFGQREMLKAGIESTYIPHAIDTNVFCPGDKLAARRELGLHEDKFLCLIAAANYYYPSRKAFPEQMVAFAEFHKEFPDSELLLHTALTPTSNAGGLDLNDLIRNLGLFDCTCNTPEYDICMGLPDERMALMYRAADVLLGASYCEGFGLCQMESLACGTPIIVHDFAASPEYLFAGEKVPSVQQFWNLLACWQAIPSIPAITQALRKIYLDRDLYVEQGLQAAERVRKELDHEVVKEQYWKPLLDQVEQGIGQSTYRKEQFDDAHRTEAVD